MKTFSELKNSAKSQIKGKIGILFLMLLIVQLITNLLQLVPVAGIIGSFVVGSSFTLGMTWVFLKVAGGEGISVGNVFYGFEDFWTAVKGQFFVGLFICLWSLLLVVPGLIKAYSYSMTFYILAENKGMSVLEAITLSRKMMDGHKMDLFLLFLSFFGWFLLVAITFGIAGIWVAPYFYATVTNFYLSVKEDYMAKMG